MCPTPGVEPHERCDGKGHKGHPNDKGKAKDGRIMEMETGIVANE